VCSSAVQFRIRADRLYIINRLSPREAVMVEPTACAVHGMEVLDAKP
jgi:threonine dehydrogenase-like Zn-dependent dehydrogenase